jgi:predicted aldo/keto reductase-like oxidoreductase
MNDWLGKDIPKLGFGLMCLPQTGGVIDVEQTKQMVDMFLGAGFRYFDTAYGYPGSEAAIKAALVDRYPRSSYMLTTKLPAWIAKTKEEARGLLATSLERTGAGYFDFYLLHNLGENRTAPFDKFDIWDFAFRKKEEGVLRHVGFSIHDKADVLEDILKAHPEAEFVQLQINYADWENPTIESRKCYETAMKYGKPVIIMEPVKGGRLASPPEKALEILKGMDEKASPASWAVRYAASLDGVITVLSGMSSVEQMRDNISYMKDFRPLTDAERAGVMKAGEIINSVPSIPCTACGYCMKGCPMNVAIYGTFQAMNMYKQFGDLASAKGSYAWNTAGHGWAKASECIECGACEEVCPQHIKIRGELKAAAAVLE